MKNQTSEKRREFITRASKIIDEGNGHLEIFSRPQEMENSRRYFLAEKFDRGFKLRLTTRNNIQQHATGCANGRKM